MWADLTCAACLSARHHLPRALQDTARPDLVTATDRIVYGALNIYRDAAANLQVRLLHHTHTHHTHHHHHHHHHTHLSPQLRPLLFAGKIYLAAQPT